MERRESEPLPRPDLITTLRRRNLTVIEPHPVHIGEISLVDIEPVIAQSPQRRESVLTERQESILAADRASEATVVNPLLACLKVNIIIQLTYLMAFVGVTIGYYNSWVEIVQMQAGFGKNSFAVFCGLWLSTVLAVAQLYVCGSVSYDYFWPLRCMESINNFVLYVFACMGL